MVRSHRPQEVAGWFPPQQAAPTAARRQIPRQRAGPACLMLNEDLLQVGVSLRSAPEQRREHAGPGGRGLRGGARQTTFGAASHSPANPDLVLRSAVGAVHAGRGQAMAATRHTGGGTDSPGTGRPADQRGLGAMAFLAGSAPLRQGCCLAHVVVPALCRPLRPGASVNPESTLTAMTIGVAAMSAHTRLIGSRCRVISASSSHCRGR